MDKAIKPLLSVEIKKEVEDKPALFGICGYAGCGAEDSWPRHA